MNMPCMDCNTNTKLEYFMVNFDLWEKTLKLDPNAGFLCVGCMEERLGRVLNESDFLDCPLNKITLQSRRGWHGLITKRLLNRMQRPKP